MYRRVIANNELVSYKRSLFGMWWRPWRNYDREVSYLSKKESSLYEKYKAARNQRIIAETNVKEDKRRMQSSLIENSYVDFVATQDIDILSTRSGVKYDFVGKSGGSDDGKNSSKDSKSSDKGGKSLGSLKIKGKDGKEVSIASLKVSDPSDG